LSLVLSTLPCDIIRGNVTVQELPIASHRGHVRDMDEGLMRANITQHQIRSFDRSP
jgi:hypothetical protein